MLTANSAKTTERKLSQARELYTEKQNHYLHYHFGKRAEEMFSPEDCTHIHRLCNINLLISKSSQFQPSFESNSRSIWFL